MRESDRYPISAFALRDVVPNACDARIAPNGIKTSLAVTKVLNSALDSGIA